MASKGQKFNKYTLDKLSAKYKHIFNTENNCINCR